MRLLWLLVAAMVIVLVPACSQPAPTPAPSPSTSPTVQPVVVVGQGETVESRILANLYSGALNAARDYSEIVQVGSDDKLLPALEAAEVSVVGLTVSDAATQLNDQVPSPIATPSGTTDVASATNNLRDLASQDELVVLNPADARVGLAFAVRLALAKENGLENLSDLAAYSNDNAVVLGGPAACQQNPRCLPGLVNTYGLKVASFVDLGPDPAEAPVAIQDGRVDVAAVDSADGQLEAMNLAVLADDQNLQPVENLIPILREEAASPSVVEALNNVSARLTTRALRDMSHSVVQLGEAPGKVADAWLAVNGLA